MDIVMGVLDIAITNNIDKRYVKYITKTISQTKILVIPNIIYVYAPNHNKDELIADLLKLILDKYKNKKDIPNSKQDSIGKIVGTTDNLELFSIMSYIHHQSYFIDINVSQVHTYSINIIDTPLQSTDITNICIEI